MQNMKMIIEYDGSNYSGWQVQKNTPMTIQGKLETALKKINKKEIRVHGAGRTDAGVHALGQVANCTLLVDIPSQRFPAAINRLLPGDIVCQKAEKVDIDFHSRYDSKGKKYRYRIYNNKLPSVFIRNYAYHYIHKLNLILIKEALEQFVGTHDFSSFQSAACTNQNTIKTIESIEISQKDEEIWIDIKGNGFLYNMIRIIVGTLIELSEGKIQLEELKDIFDAKDRHQAGFTAPANGLTLLEVYY